MVRCLSGVEFKSVIMVLVYICLYNLKNQFILVLKTKTINSQSGEIYSDS